MSFLKTVLRPGVYLAREAIVRSDFLRQKSAPGPLAVFLPAYERTGAALLRIYMVSEAIRAEGWRSLVLPWRLTLSQRRRLLAHARPDVLVMQGGRHALNRPALYPGVPIVYDLDDADFHLPHLAKPVTDAMAKVAAVVAGSDYIADWCRGQGAKAHVVWTGMPPSSRLRPPQLQRGPVVAWAQTRPMTYRREADLVFDVMSRLTAMGVSARLRLYDRWPGDDPALLHRFMAAGIETEWVPTMPLPEYLASFDDVALGLAPLCPETPFSRGKSFGKVLAYLDAHVPVIASDAGEHGRFFTPESGVVSNDPAHWAARAQALLASSGARQAMANAGFSLFQSRLSTDAAARGLARILAEQVHDPGVTHIGGRFTV